MTFTNNTSANNTSGSIWNSYTTTGTSAAPNNYAKELLDMYKEQWWDHERKLSPTTNPEDTIPVKKKQPIETDILDF